MQIFRLATIGALLLSAAACGAPERGAPAVEVEEAWVRLPAVPGRPAAAYFTLRAYNADIRLTGVTSSDAERVELHDTRMEGGIARMVPLADAVIAQGRELSFEPGGAHAMLFGLGDSVGPGGRVALTFNFDGAPSVDVQAEARAASGEGHGGR
jgi:periplasmic copper chaperone A